MKRKHFAFIFSLLFKHGLKLAFLIGCPWLAGVFVGVYYGFVAWLVYLVVWLLIAYKWKPLKEYDVSLPEEIEKNIREGMDKKK